MNVRLVETIKISKMVHVAGESKQVGARQRFDNGGKDGFDARRKQRQVNIDKIWRQDRWAQDVKVEISLEQIE